MVTEAEMLLPPGYYFSLEQLAGDNNNSLIFTRKGERNMKHGYVSLGFYPILKIFLIKL